MTHEQRSDGLPAGMQIHQVYKIEHPLGAGSFGITGQCPQETPSRILPAERILL